MQIFEDFCAKLEKWAKGRNKRIMLLADNAPSHKINEEQYPSEDIEGLRCIRFPNYPNMLVVFLPPNTTSHVQPLDAGIIRCFKALYKQKLLTWLIELADKAEATGTEFDVSHAKASVKQVHPYRLGGLSKMSICFEDSVDLDLN